MENLSKNTSSKQPQGVSLSIADAKVAHFTHTNQIFYQLFLKEILRKITKH